MWNSQFRLYLTLTYSIFGRMWFLKSYKCWSPEGIVKLLLLLDFEENLAIEKYIMISGLSKMMMALNTYIYLY